VSLCAATDGRSCFAILLDDPHADCDAEVVGPWCLHWEGDGPGPGDRRAVRTLLATFPEPWVEPDGSVPDVASRRPGAPVRIRPLASAAAALGLPVLVGAIVARRLRATGWKMRLGAVSGFVVAFGAAVRVVEPGAWDVLLTVVLGLSGAAAAAARFDRRDAAAFLVASVVAVSCVEGAVRRWLAPLDEIAPAADTGAAPGGARADVGCSVLFDAPDVDAKMRELHASPRPPVPKAGPIVAHVGDSMTFGYGVDERHAFPALLNSRDENAVHVNYGVWAVGTDFEYLLVQRIVAVNRPALVVLHVYAGNDIYDIDRPYECCDGGPLLHYAADGVRPACPTARWRTTWRARLARAPLPHPVRALLPWSQTARHAAVLFARAAIALDPPPHFVSGEGEATEEGWDHFTRIVRTLRDALRDADVRFMLTIIPSRASLTASPPESSPSYRTGIRIARIAAELGVPTRNAWEAFRRAVERDGDARYFLGAHDIHFNAEGHRLFADWLATQLPSSAGASARRAR